MDIPAVVEGYMESVFLPVVLRQIGRSDLKPVVNNAGGASKFWSIAKRYNDASRHKPMMGLADLEQAVCAPMLLAAQLTHKNAGFHLRIAVRMLESWLIADRNSLAKFLKVPIAAVPTDPDAEHHAKRKLVDIARQSKRRSVRDALVPEDSGGIVGADYVATMCEFITAHWRVDAARNNSPSLDRACQRWEAI